MTSKEAIQKLESIKGYEKDGTNDNAHIRADEILLDFLKSNGYESVALAYEAISSGFWYE